MQVAAASVAPTSEVATDPCLVMIVDDDRAITNGLAELLESEGYSVVTAADGVEAMQQLRGGLRPSIILLDLMMPRMDGWDFRHEQMRDPDLRDIPVIVITAAGFSEASLRTQFGDIEFVPKPPPAQDLLDAVRRRCGELIP